MVRAGSTAPVFIHCTHIVARVMRQRARSQQRELQHKHQRNDRHHRWQFLHASGQQLDGGVARLVVDCSQLLHVDYRLVPRLADALLRFEAHAGVVVLCGLSRYLRDLFRIAGCESKLCCWPTAADLLDAVPAAAGLERERAS